MWAIKIFFISYNEKNLHAVLYNLKFIKTNIFSNNKTIKINAKLSIKFNGIWKLNLRLYAKYNVKSDIKVSLNKKNKILFNGDGVSNKIILI